MVSDTAQMILEIEDAEIEAMIVCVNEKFLGKEFLKTYRNYAVVALAILTLLLKDKQKNIWHGITDIAN